MKRKHTQRLVVPIMALGLWTCVARVEAETLIKNICHVKGQEENTLQGLGLVVGLNGTGDGGSFLPTLRNMAKTMTVLREPLGKEGLLELKNAKNVALVLVTAKIPATGGREGDKLDCVVSSIGTAKDLTGGRLFLTPLIGPNRNDSRVYAFAEGPISLDDPSLTTSGRIHGGCRLEEDFFNTFVKDGKLTLVLEKNHADWEIAQLIVEQINKSPLTFESGGLPLAKALDQTNIVVTIPPQYRDDLVLFISRVLSQPLRELKTDARVVINERSGNIVIGEEVEIGAVVITHKNVVIETGDNSAANRFVPINPSEPEAPKLKELYEALNAVHVPTEDIIDIIKGLNRSGNLHGELIIE